MGTANRRESVLEIIKRTAADPEHKELVSVLALPCGTGKSTAISEIIRERLEAWEAGGTEGLLVITNNNKQLNLYLNPRAPETRDYIQSHMDGVTLMYDENYRTALAAMGRCPVLLITSQRYFRLSYLDIRQRYLLYTNKEGVTCRRTLVLIDEETKTHEQITLTMREINDVHSVLTNAITDTADPEEKKWCRRQWDIFRNFFDRTLSDLEAGANGREVLYRYYVAPEREIDGARRNAWNITADDERFWRFVNAHISDFTHYQRKKDLPDAYTSLLAVRQLMLDGGVYVFRSAAQSGTYESSFVICLNYRLYYDPSLETKFIVLDATGGYTPDYHEDYFHVQRFDEYREQLPNAKIFLVDIPTGGTLLDRFENERNKVLTRVNEVLGDVVSGEEPYAIFTYMDDMEESFRNMFPRALVAHFGAIRGLNEYTECHTIAQVGMFRKSPAYYFQYELLEDEPYFADLYNRAGQGEVVELPVASRTDEHCRHAQESMWNLLLAEVEQNFYRSAVRSDPTAECRYYIFLSFQGYQKLIDKMFERFGEVGIKLEYIDEENRQLSACERFLRWYRQLPVGHEYTTEDIRVAMGLPNGSNPRDHYRENATVGAIIARDRLPNRRGKYKKMA